MFPRLKIWLSGQSGLREATRDAARQATRDGLTEGFQLGVVDFLDELTGFRSLGSTSPTEAIENGRPIESPPEPFTAGELRGKRKPELLQLAQQRGIAADDSWTVAGLMEELTARN